MTARLEARKAARVDYDVLERQVRELVGDEPDALANAANFAAFVFAELSGVSWAGFYFADPAGDLVLGPFQGRPACTRLQKGQGVCGAAFTSGETVVVDDVSAFAGHIVCDSAARSEIVVPLFSGGHAYGVFDVDSTALARFGEADRLGIERLVRAFADHACPGGIHRAQR